jgi:hypothetical protein
LQEPCHLTTEKPRLDPTRRAPKRQRCCPHRPLPMRAYRGPYAHTWFQHWRRYSAGCGCTPRCAASAPLTAPAIT